MEIKFDRYDFDKRLSGMLAADMRRMFVSPFVYIMVGVSFVIPILILVMTTMMAGTTTVNPETNVETTIEAFESVWLTIGTSSSAGTAMDMSLTGMCNINMLYFLTAVLVSIFVSDDFRSGYAKNLFAARASKVEYVISKTLVCSLGGALMILAFFIGAMLGGAISGLPFELAAVGTTAGGVVMCLLSKVLLVTVFVPIYLLMSVIGKGRLWLSIVGSLAVSMLLFTMIPMITPLDAGVMNVVLCLLGGALFCTGMGAISNIVLKKTALV